MDNKEILMRMTEHWRKVIATLEGSGDTVDHMRSALSKVAQAIQLTGEMVPANVQLGISLQIAVSEASDEQVRELHRKWLSDAKKAAQFNVEMGKDMGWSGVISHASEASHSYDQSKDIQNEVVASSDAHTWQSIRNYSLLFHGEWGINYEAGIALAASIILQTMIYVVIGWLPWLALISVPRLIIAGGTGVLFIVVNRFVRRLPVLPFVWGATLVIYENIIGTISGYMWHSRLEVFASEALMIYGFIVAVRNWGTTRMSLLKGAVWSAVPVLLFGLFFTVRSGHAVGYVMATFTDRVLLALLLFYAFARYFERGHTLPRMAGAVSAQIRQVTEAKHRQKQDAAPGAAKVQRDELTMSWSIFTEGKQAEPEAHAWRSELSSGETHIEWRRKKLPLPPGSSWWKRTFSQPLEPVYQGPQHSEVLIRSVKPATSDIELPDDFASVFHEEMKQGFLKAGYKVRVPDSSAQESLLEMVPLRANDTSMSLIIDIFVLEYTNPGFLTASLQPFASKAILRVGLALFDKDQAKPFALLIAKRSASRYGMAALVLHIASSIIGNMAVILQDICVKVPDEIKRQHI